MSLAIESKPGLGDGQYVDLLRTPVRSLLPHKMALYRLHTQLVNTNI